jgi:D-amino peptidase
MPFNLKKIKKKFKKIDLKNLTQKKQKYKPKIWIYADMEGVNNVTNWEQVNPAYIRYKEGAELMTKELSSVVKGVLRGGAESVYINDLHWFYNNIIWNKIDKRALSCAGSNLNIKDFFAKYFDAVVIVGMHAKAKTENAILPHSWYLPTYIDSLEYNNKYIGEIEMIKFLADEKGVPVIFLSGDRAGCYEAKESCPNIILAETKFKQADEKINLISEKKALKLVFDKSKEAVKNFRSKPEIFNIKSEVSSEPLIANFATKEITDSIEFRCKKINFDYERNGNKTIKFLGNSFSEILKNFFSVLD